MFCHFYIKKKIRSQKRAQLTLYVLVGIVVIIVTTVAFFAFGFNKNDGKVLAVAALESDSHDVRSLVQDCLETVSQKALAESAYEGFSGQRSEISSRGVRVFYSDNKTKLPTADEIEALLQGRIENELLICTAGFAHVENNVYRTDDMKVKARLESTELRVSAIYPLEITNNISSLDVDKRYDVVLPSRQGLLLQLAQTTVKELSNPEGICITCLSEEAQKVNATINVIGQDQSSMLVQLESMQEVLRFATEN